MFNSSSASSGLELRLINYTSIYEKSELIVFEKQLFLSNI